MAVLKSNLYHLIVKPKSLHKYTIQTSPKIASPTDFEQIIRYFQDLEPSIIGVDNGFYIKNLWERKTTHNVMLSKGELVSVILSLNTDPYKEKQFLEGILHKIMVNTKFLMCRILNSCYNPFEERKTETGSETPGFRLALYHQSQVGMFIIPEIMEIVNSTDILNGNILINTETGNFYNKSDVVKVDKEKDLLTFRDKSEINKRSLKPINVRPIVGYELAVALENYWKRIQMTSSELIAYWSISISQNPQDMQVAFVDPGMMTMSKVEKMLNNMVFPVAQNAYNEYYKSNFDVAFEEFPSLEIYVCYGSDKYKAQILIECIESIRDRMNLSIVIYKAEDWDISNFIPRPNVLYLILANSTFLSKKQIRQSLVLSEVIYHIVDQKSIETNNKNLNEVTALQTLNIICSKFIKAPWKLKNIPFCNQPLSVISLDISSSKTEQLSVAMTFSINSFLSKFISIIEEVPEKELGVEILKMIQNCLIRFQEYHKRFPNRMILFSSNNRYISEDIYNQLRSKLSVFYSTDNKAGSALDFILVTHQPCPSLRTYKMMTHLINPQTVTKAGLLCCLVFANKLCLQLEMQSCMSEFTVFHESNDPDFLKKMSELIVKLSFGAVDNKFGGGLGIIGYSSKLNKYKDVDLSKWKSMLWEGHMLYL